MGRRGGGVERGTLHIGAAAGRQVQDSARRRRIQGGNVKQGPCSAGAKRVCGGRALTHKGGRPPWSARGIRSHHHSPFSSLRNCTVLGKSLALSSSHRPRSCRGRQVARQRGVEQGRVAGTVRALEEAPGLWATAGTPGARPVSRRGTAALPPPAVMLGCLLRSSQHGPCTPHAHTLAPALRPPTPCRPLAPRAPAARGCASRRRTPRRRRVPRAPRCCCPCGPGRGRVWPPGTRAGWHRPAGGGVREAGAALAQGACAARPTPAWLHVGAPARPAAWRPGPASLRAGGWAGGQPATATATEARPCACLRLHRLQPLVRAAVGVRERRGAQALHVRVGVLQAHARVLLDELVAGLQRRAGGRGEKPLRELKLLTRAAAGRAECVTRAAPCCLQGGGSPQARRRAVPSHRRWLNAAEEVG